MVYRDNKGNVWSSKEVYDHYMHEKQSHEETHGGRQPTTRASSGKKPKGMLFQFQSMVRGTRSKPKSPSRRVVYVERRAKPKKRPPKKKDIWDIDPFSW